MNKLGGIPVDLERRPPARQAGGPARTVLALASLFCGSLACLPQQPAPLHFTATQTNLTLHASNDVALYYLVEQSTNLLGFSPWSMKLGNGGPSWTVSYDSAPAGFYRGRWFSLYGPGDFDADGMDDVWELGQGLNPLNPADAGYTNSATGLTWLQTYNTLYGRRMLRDEAISHEVSLYNFGVDQPGGRFEAISSEMSLYNHGVDLPGGRYEAIAKEVTLYIGEHPPHPLYPDAISREMSLYNFGVIPGGTEAISREVTIYRGERPAELHQEEAVSREVTLYNFGVDVPGGRYEAISREVSLYNGDLGPQGASLEWAPAHAQSAKQ